VWFLTIQRMHEYCGVTLLRTCTCKYLYFLHSCDKTFILYEIVFVEIMIISSKMHDTILAILFILTTSSYSTCTIP
jgi:hypothetical protein